jgi:hypothetical protein
MTYRSNKKASGGRHAFVLPVTEEMLYATPMSDPLQVRVNNK